MAKLVTYQSIEQKLSEFKEKFQTADIPYILLSAFGTTDTYINRYKSGKGILTSFDGLLVKGVIAYRCVATEQLTPILDSMKTELIVQRARPRLLVVSDGVSVLAYDLKENETYENRLSKLWLDFQFFYPLAGIERYRGVEENPADVKAAEKMAKLHDEIRRYNEFSSSADLHDLNIFMTRLLFCYFAEDTGIFEDNLFTASISQYTQENGSDISDYLNACFNVMDKDLRVGIPSIISQFPYVNGGLFHKHIVIPRMGWRARKLILECGGLNWKDINPDIFGSMIQAVVAPDMRGSLGMHYTSVPNIMKVIQPLFLDNLYEEYANIPDLDPALEPDKAKSSVKRLKVLLLRISRMKFFDPACGSGNFLIIAYKELRKLEIQIWKQIAKLNHGQVEIPFVNVQLNQFYGIEIDDFAHEVAMLSLWLAEHQMNCLFTREFANVRIPALPLRTNGNIHQGNACRMDWNEVCPHTKEEEVFVMGNPPYLGARLQEEHHKMDMEFVFQGIKGYNNLDYIACWFYKGSQYIQGSKSRVALVSTNSICQGEQVALLWSHILPFIDIYFAYLWFKWTNNAKSNAGVTCTVIGLIDKLYKEHCYLLDTNKKSEVEYINAYLAAGSKVIIKGMNKSLSKFPALLFGSMPNDGGHLLLDSEERKILINEDERSSIFIHRFLGSQEFIRGEEKYCLWITDEFLPIAISIPSIRRRIERCRESRIGSKRYATQKLAEKAHRFGEIRYKNTDKIIVPSVSSERREYIPIGYLDKDSVVSNLAFAIYDAPMWLFGILTSKIHMIWVKAVGGYLGTSIRYSAQLCYNPFPFPKLTKEKEHQIQEAAEEVLLCREEYPAATLAELYDPDKMPQNLRDAHHLLDLLVESCYQDKPFENDEERLELLFKLYEKMTKKEK